jgi:PIN domain nuclease of toxin-antitoxin system
MRLLIDTHVLLWALTDSPRLKPRIRELLLEPGNEPYFSAASIWEIAIKRTLRKADMPVSAEQARTLLLDSGYKELAISSTHAATVESLSPIHADPFDRILVAQSMSEPMHLITHDKIVASYQEGTILA